MDIVKEKLGVIYSPEETIFRVWAPKRNMINLALYKDSLTRTREIYNMKKKPNGVHECIIKVDLKDKFYTYLVEGSHEVTDPYSIASSINSQRSGIIDLSETDPNGWENHREPLNRPICEEIIYELNIKDFSISPSSGAYHRGKFLGLCEEKIQYNGSSTGIDHLEELGITAVHLMPVFDFSTVNEEEEFFYKDGNYNWGYDPEHYNVPEGSYGTDPRNPKSRILELKTMIMKLHEKDIKVILDVVYNHTYKTQNSNFNIINPDYYYRKNPDGTYSDGAGCGNELATEKPMVRKFIIDSLEYWLREYRVDGFRFDLMALIDRETMEEITSSLRKYKKDLIIYGEPWTAGPTVLEKNLRTRKGCQTKLGIAMFNDGFRDAIKGDNDGLIKGFSQGNIHSKIETETGIVGSISYDEKHRGFTRSPEETINYINSHDNLILYDKIKKLFPVALKDEIILYNKLAFSILLTSQGIPFIHGGNEFLRSKNMDKNSYNSGIWINQIDWSLKEKNRGFYEYIRDLILLRKKYKEFTLSTEEEIKKGIKFLDMKLQGNLIAYTLKMESKGEYLLVLHNGNNTTSTIYCKNIRSHLIYWSNMKVENLYLREIFNLDGIVEGREERKNIERININKISTTIYRVRID